MQVRNVCLKLETSTANMCKIGIHKAQESADCPFLGQVVRVFCWSLLANKNVKTCYHHSPHLPSDALSKARSLSECRPYLHAKSSPEAAACGCCSRSKDRDVVGVGLTWNVRKNTARTKRINFRSRFKGQSTNHRLPQNDGCPVGVPLNHQFWD